MNLQGDWVGGVVLPQLSYLPFLYWKSLHSTATANTASPLPERIWLCSCLALGCSLGLDLSFGLSSHSFLPLPLLLQHFSCLPLHRHLLLHLLLLHRLSFISKLYEIRSVFNVTGDLLNCVEFLPLPQLFPPSFLPSCHHHVLFWHLSILMDSPSVTCHLILRLA